MGEFIVRKSNWKAALFLVSVVVVGGPGFAQWSPDASSNLGIGMGGIAVGQGIIQGTRNIGAGKTSRNGGAARPEAGATTAPRLSKERIDAHLNALRPEYEHRVARDGLSAANRWLGDMARELGRQEGMKARRSE